MKLAVLKNPIKVVLYSGEYSLRNSHGGGRFIAYIVGYGLEFRPIFGFRHSGKYGQISWEADELGGRRSEILGSLGYQSFWYQEYEDFFKIIETKITYELVGDSGLEKLLGSLETTVNI